MPLFTDLPVWEAWRHTQLVEFELLQHAYLLCSNFSEYQHPQLDDVPSYDEILPASHLTSLGSHFNCN